MFEADPGQYIEKYWKTNILVILILILILKLAIPKYWYWYRYWNNKIENIDIDIDIENFEKIISILMLILKKSGKNIEKRAPAVWLSNVSLPLGK